MLRKFIIPLFLSAFLPLTSSEFSQFQQHIDFSNFKTNVYNVVYEPTAWRLGFSSFNHSPEIIPVFLLLKKDFQIEAAVETGTNLGNTTALLSLIFDEVHTIEILEDVYNTTKGKLKDIDNVKCHLGSSEKVLGEILPSLSQKRTLFYLDAHWYSYWPLRDELEQISRTHKDNCVIVVDDFQVPGRNDIPFDSYGHHSCSLEYIKGKLKKVFTDYDYYYVIPRNPYCRAKFVAFPKYWNF